MSQAFKKSVDEMIQTTSSRRADLASGRLVALFVGDVYWGGAEVDGDQPGQAPVAFWYHLADHSFKPWESLFAEVRPMLPFEIEIEDGRLQHSRFVDLKAVGKEFMYHELFDTFPHTHRWHVVFFEVV